MIDWDEIWRKFDRWFDRGGHCGSWEEQAKKIEKLVEKQLKDNYEVE